MSKVRMLKDLIRKKSVEFVVLQESLVTSDATGVVNALWIQSNFSFCHIPAEGHSGGILSTWRNESFEAINAFVRKGFLYVEGRWKGSPQLISILNIYAPQDDGEKRKLWVDVCSYLATSSKLYCLMSDFNYARREEERFGCEFHQRRAADFNAFISAVDLQEFHIGGRRFTWVGPGGLKLSKLDRFLLSRELVEAWTDVAVVALDRCFSDHCPIPT